VEQDRVDCHCCRASNLRVCDPALDKQPPCHAVLPIKTRDSLFSCRLRLTPAKRFSRHLGCPAFGSPDPPASATLPPPCLWGSGRREEGARHA
jgi:hypothetical protein